MMDERIFPHASDIAASFSPSFLASTTSIQGRELPGAVPFPAVAVAGGPSAGTGVQVPAAPTGGHELLRLLHPQ